MTTTEIKPRDIWDTEDRLDFMDGWHEASELHFKSSRDPARPVHWHDLGPCSVCDKHGCAHLLRTHSVYLITEMGRAARVTHRELNGI